jgi:hypothetical protein
MSGDDTQNQRSPLKLTVLGANHIVMKVIFRGIWQTLKRREDLDFAGGFLDAGQVGTGLMEWL